MTLGFRGSEETRLRKQRIDSSLHLELEKKIEEFMTSEAARGGNPDRIIGIRELGYKAVVAEDISKELIAKSDRTMKKAIFSLLGAIVILTLAVIQGLSLDFSQSTNLLVVAVYIGITCYLFGTFIQSALRSLRLREQLIELDETPNLELGCNMGDKIW